MTFLQAKNKNVIFVFLHFPILSRQVRKMAVHPYTAGTSDYIRSSLKRVII